MRTLVAKTSCTWAELDQRDFLLLHRAVGVHLAHSSSDFCVPFFAGAAWVQIPLRASLPLASESL